MPAGKAWTQGMREADGTDCAWSHNFSSWVQDPFPLQPPMTAAPPGFALELANTQAIGTAAGISTSRTTSRSATRRVLQRWIAIGRGGVGSRRTNSAARSEEHTSELQS